MNIPQTELDFRPYISDEQPVDIELPEGYTMDVNVGQIDESVMYQLAEFYKTNNKMASGNVTVLSIANIQSIMNCGGHNVIMKRNGVIVGSIFSLPLEIGYKTKLLPDIIEDMVATSGPLFQLSPNYKPEPVPANNLEKVKSSYTTHLCIRPDHRTRGYAMALIRKVMNSGYPSGIRHGYYFTSRIHHQCHQQIHSFFRPINIVKAQQDGFYVPTVASQTRQRLMYRTETGKNWSNRRVRAGDSEALGLIRKWGDYRLMFSPSQELWDDILENYRCHRSEERRVGKEC